MLNPSFYSALAKSILAAEANADAVTARINRTLGLNSRWTRTLAVAFIDRFGAATPPSRRDAIVFLRGSDTLRAAEVKHKGKLRIAHWLTGGQTMHPAPAARNWSLPRIETTGELAAWLGVSDGELAWFADLKSLNARAPMGPLHHYHYRVLAKSKGSFRLIESPHTRLKQLQKVVLHEILDAIPANTAAHGFVKGRSIKTFAAPHVGQRVVLRMDLQDFFPSISRARVQALFHTAGYPEDVAGLLSGMCTNVAPRGLWKSLGNSFALPETAAVRALYTRPHLPQGAPTSPSLANLCAWRVDCRLSGLARAGGALYTRYADDLAFSGDAEFERSVERFAIQAAAILLEEGFQVHHRKTRVMRQGVRQYVAGIVTNEHLNVVRADFDRLKAILTNCARHGPASQNREAHAAFRQHLDGRIGFVEMIHAAKGARLRRIFDRIEWKP